MQSKTVSALEAIRIFYIGDHLLPGVFAVKRLSRKIVEIRLKKMMGVALTIPDEKLINYHMDHWGIRYYNYLNASWKLTEVALDDCGVWPIMGKLPEEATYGSARDTAEYARYLLDHKSEITWGTHRVLYFEHLMTYADLINKYVPIILLEGGVIRKNHLKEIKRSHMMKDLPYDIDDGNHRAVALALLGKANVKAIVGKRIHKSDLFH